MCLILGFKGKVVSLMPLSTPLVVGVFFPSLQHTCHLLNKHLAFALCQVGIQALKNIITFNPCNHMR